MTKFYSLEQNIHGKADWLKGRSRDFTCYAGGMDGYKFHQQNFEFEAALNYKHVTRGRSAARAVYEDQFGNKLEMFMTDFDDLVHTCGNVKTVVGVWTFCKRGANIGVKYVRPLDDSTNQG